MELPKLHLITVFPNSEHNKNLIQIKDGIATATNGYYLVRCDLKKRSMLTDSQIAALNGKYIHKDVWRELCKAESVEFKADCIEVNNNIYKAVLEYAEPRDKWYNVDKLIRSVKESPQTPKSIISFDSTYISDLAQIFESDELVFCFTERSEVVVYDYINSGMCALLMPIACDNEVYLF